MTKDTHYYSDWIENTGTMPVGITNETVLEVQYVGCSIHLQMKGWADDFYWERMKTKTDIDMYRYVYDTVAVAQEASE